MTPTILFVDRRSIYKKMGLDCYDIDRDACTYTGPHPVVAHPPCRTWSITRGLSTAPVCEKLLTFVALACVRQFGGVLEHPKSSGFWPAASLPMPGAVDKWGGYTLCVDQFWWGHKATKSTLLYIIGCSQRDLPPIPLRFDAVQYTVSSSRRKGQRLPEVTKKERSATPPAFAQWLVDTATRCRV